MKVVPEKNAVRILWGRERGTHALGAQRLLQELVEDKTRWMKWEGKVKCLKELVAEFVCM